MKKCYKNYSYLWGCA